MQAQKNWFCALSCKDFLGHLRFWSSFRLYPPIVPLAYVERKKNFASAQNSGRWCLIVRVLALRLEEMAQREQFVSGMIGPFPLIDTPPPPPIEGISKNLAPHDKEDQRPTNNPPWKNHFVQRSKKPTSLPTQKLAILTPPPPPQGIPTPSIEGVGGVHTICTLCRQFKAVVHFCGTLEKNAVSCLQ